MAAVAPPPARAPAQPARVRPEALLGVSASRRRAYEGLEYSVHGVSGSLRRDVAAVFPSADATAVLLVPVLQRATVPLEAFGDVQAAEKDRLQARFFAWAAELRDALAAGGHWADATDPATGAALFGDQAALYGDVPPIARLLRYPTHDAGGCTILLHPKWRSAVYPASFFTTAPVEVLLDALERFNRLEPEGEVQY